MDLTVGPNQFFWNAATVQDFYAGLCDAPVARVVIGEVICSKRLPFWQDRIPAAIRRLREAGKAVAMSTLGLITLPRERRQTADLMDMGVTVEVNDLSALGHVPAGMAFWVGPLVNVYNEGTLAFLARRGARRICLPPELPLQSIRTLCAAGRDMGIAIEIWGHGRTPLALSARCYHARLHDRTKDGCQFVCGEDPDGREVDTLDGQKFLAVNGIQTLSFATASAARQIEALADAGVASLRISPQTGDFGAILQGYTDRIAGRVGTDAFVADLRDRVPGRRLSDGFLQGSLGADWSKSTRTTGG